MAEEKTAEQKKSARPGRVVFVDQARALALTMMLVGHSLHQFLAEPWRSSDAYHEYQFYRGITSALFLMVSGFSFVVASFKYWDDYTRISPRLIARARRIAYILFLAYLLHLYGGTLYRMTAWYTPSKMTGFLRFDVLQNIGFSLLMLHVAAFAVKKIEHFWKITLVLLAGIISIAAYTYDPAVDAALPIWLSPAVNMYHRSLFPMVPFTAFMLVGAFFGYWFWKTRQSGNDWKLMLVFAATGLAFIGGEYVLRNIVQGEVFPYASSMPQTPGNTFARCGSAMLVISAFYFLEKVVKILPRLSLLMSQDSLAIYVVHLPIVYGGTFGLSQRYKEGMSLTWTVVFLVALFAAMIGMAWSIQQVRKRWPAYMNTIRRTAIIAWALQFVFWQSFTLWSIVVSVGLAMMFMNGWHKKIAERIEQQFFAPKSTKEASSTD